MIRWFADLPIERKLRVVILFPAIAVFAVAMTVHIAINLMHLRDDLLWSTARVARVTGANTIDALRQGDEQAALGLAARSSSFSLIKAHLRRRCLSHLTQSPGHAGAGGDRSRAMSERISANICRDTATSAI